MRLGEVSLLTNQVICMSEFYRALLEDEIAVTMLFIKQSSGRKRC